MVMKKAKHSKKMNRYFIASIHSYNDILLFFLDMYSILQLRAKYFSDVDDEIPLPEINAEGKTALNELEVKKCFSI